MIFLHPVVLIVPSLLFPHLTTALAPALIPYGGLSPGYLGPLPTPPSGDHLLETGCRCGATPPYLSTGPDVATYLQYDYYNFHYNATFFWDHLCLENYDTGIYWVDCLARNETLTKDGFYLLKGKWGRDWCRVWGGESRGRRFDGWATLCFNIYFPHGHIIFNGQKRALGPSDGQHPTWSSQEEIETACDDICIREAGMPKKADEGAMKSWQMQYTLDDMCDGCK